MPLYLASHVHVCQSNGQIVCLDVRRDEYIGIDWRQAEFLASVVVEWPLSGGGHPTPLPADCGLLLEKWKELGMLTSSIPETPRKPLSVLRAESSLVDDLPGVAPSANTRFLGRLAVAAIRAAALRRSLSFETLLLRQQARRAACERSASSRAIQDISGEVARFLYFRSLIYRARRHCLFDSLVLLEFLAQQGCCPQWVWGVRAAPFRAHCWLQEGVLTYNDAPEHVRQYTPILAV